jgi:Fe-S oxidoreductase
MPVKIKGLLEELKRFPDYTELQSELDEVMASIASARTEEGRCASICPSSIPPAALINLARMLKKENVK